MSDAEPPKGRFAAFWTSLPGVITGIAGLIGAIAAILALFVVPGGSGDSETSRAEWASKVNPICSEAENAIRQIPAPSSGDANSFIDYYHQESGIIRDGSEKIRGIEAPVEDKGNIDHLTLLWDQQADGLDLMAQAVQNNDQAGFASAQQQVLSTDTEARGLSSSLGITACAQHPAPTGPA